VSHHPRTNESAAEVISAEDIGLRARTFGSRFVALGIMSVIAGVAAGIALSLAFVIGLNSLNLG
jgi:transketolase C-terminal domain/subunit